MTTRVNPDVQSGLGRAAIRLQYGIALQQEIRRAVGGPELEPPAVGNFFVTDNMAVLPSDYTQVSLTAPQSGKLPDGGGYPAPFNVRNTNRTTIGATDNYYTSANDYGDWTSVWEGIDFSVDARMRSGLVLQAGLAPAPATATSVR